MEENRSLNGYGNNVQNPEWGMAGTELIRLAPAEYADGASSPAGGNRPNPRTISNVLLNQTKDAPNRRGASDYLWAWGQFTDHDLDLTPTVSSSPFPISVPLGDPYFDTNYTGTQIIPLFRSVYNAGTGIREQLNEQTSFIDASNIYGASDERAAALRTNDGTGRLKMGPNQTLIFNYKGLPNDPNTSSRFYLAGDPRANEQTLLTCLHTLWNREHNRLAHQYWVENPDWSGEQIYQTVKTYVTALNQAITFNEYLPLLLGPISPYSGYNPNLNPQIFNEFSAACFRLGHSQVSTQLLRLRDDLEPTAEGPLPLKDAFFTPELINLSGGIDPFLRGAAFQVAQEVDARTVDPLRNFLFGEPGQGGFDLAALNIQRGRDHGLPSYNNLREALGLGRKASFEDISSDEETVSRLQQLYDTVDDVDLWVGALSEDIVAGALVGELIQAVCRMQFENVRDGDRFWYENIMSEEEIAEINSTKLSDVIRRNTSIGSELPDNVFIAGTL